MNTIIAVLLLGSLIALVTPWSSRPDNSIALTQPIDEIEEVVKVSFSEEALEEPPAEQEPIVADVAAETASKVVEADTISDEPIEPPVKQTVASTPVSDSSSKDSSNNNTATKQEFRFVYREPKRVLRWLENQGAEIYLIKDNQPIKQWKRGRAQNIDFVFSGVTRDITQEFRQLNKQSLPHQASHVYLNIPILLWDKISFSIEQRYPDVIAGKFSLEVTYKGKALKVTPMSINGSNTVKKKSFIIL